ncbi:MAG TPA: WD40 repeat domain-containing protein [Cyclobacteriaceae bacterium]
MSSIQVHKIHTLSGHRDAVYTLQPSSDPSKIFSGAGDGMVVLWDLNNPAEGELIAKLPNSIYALHHLPKDDLLVAGHNYDGIHLLDWHNKKEIASLQLGSSAIFDIQSYGNDLLIASGDGMLTIVDREGWVIKKKLLASGKSARTIAINPVTGELAVGYSDNWIRVFDLETYQLKGEWEAHANSVFTLVYSPDYKLLVSGSRDARLKSWDVAQNYAPKTEVVAHLYAINNLDFSPDGKHFVTCSLDKSVKVWDAEEFKLLKVIDKARHAGHGTSVNKLLWTSFNNQLISASDDRTLSVWHIIF